MNAQAGTGETPDVEPRPWLVAVSGVRAGTRYEITGAVTRIGRAADNDVVVQGSDAAVVSQRHCEIHRDGEGFRLRDCSSTNGTFLNGQRVSDEALVPGDAILLGPPGPQFSFVIERAPDPNATVRVPREAIRSPEPVRQDALTASYEGLLTTAVERAREARASGVGNETIMIMRDALARALRRSGQRLRGVIVLLVVALIVTSGLAGWKILQLRREKAVIDERIAGIEAQLERSAASVQEADHLISELDAYQNQGQRLERGVLFRLSGRGEKDFVTDEIRTLMAEFGAEVYSVPPEFVARVKHHLADYQNSNRLHIERALTGDRAKLDRVKKIIQDEQLPPDLAYIPVVESALDAGPTSSEGAGGLWQFTVATARAYGLRVDGQVDERRDLVKSTRAGCRYLRELILDFGAGSSVMLALAAYNSGPNKVKQAVMRTVRDPIKQRNFWYLYRVRALPAETREYVPKVIAVMIIGRNPGRFGFRES